MTASIVLSKIAKLALCVGLLGYGLELFAETGVTNKNQFVTITAQGEKIGSIFDGMRPSKYLRDTLVLRISSVKKITERLGPEHYGYCQDV